MLHRMPTSNPRLSVTVTPELSAVIERLCLLLGQSKSAFLADMLQTSVSVFERMIQALEAAKVLQDEALNAPNEFKASLRAGQERIEQQLGLALDGMDEAFRPLLKESEKVIRRAKTGSATGEARALSGGAKRGSTPRPVTRGLGRVKSPENRTVKGGKRA
jgi:hypothetical protein